DSQGYTTVRTTGVRALAARGDGYVFYIDTSPWVHSPGSGANAWTNIWTPNRGQILQMASDGLGEVYFTDSSGGLSALDNQGWTTIRTSGVRALAARGDGYVFYIDTSPWVHAPGSAAGACTNIWTPNHGQILQMASDGLGEMYFADSS